MIICVCSRLFFSVRLGHKAHHEPKWARKAQIKPIPLSKTFQMTITHPHENEQSKALEAMMAMYHDVSGDFKFQYESKGVKVSSFTPPGASMPVMRGDLCMPHSPADIVALINCVGARSQCKIKMLITRAGDDRFEGYAFRDSFFDQTTLLYTMQKGSWPVSGRDMCNISKRIYDAASGSTTIIQSSVVDPKVPEVNGRVRAQLHGALTVIRPSLEKPGWSDCTYMVNVDVMGTVPNSIIKIVSASTPLCLANISAYLSAQGVPPSVNLVRVEQPGRMLKLHRYDFDHAKKSASIALDCEQGSVSDTMEFRIDSKMYPHGLKVKNEGVAAKFEKREGGMVSIIPMAEGLVFYTITMLTSGPEGQLLIE